ncbi:MAG: acyl-CoA thioesterase [Hahellaceae bacterium]|nr:acyl-CoA thioesterase [Hahellaceae bacterium]
MFTLEINPRFSETDALGHVNNTVLPVWFEDARTPVFRLFTPDLDHKKWRLIIARVEVDFVGELFYGEPIEIRTWIDKLGNSSMVIAQEAWQNHRVGAKGRAVMIHYDYNEKKAIPIPDDIREELTTHIVVL